MANFIPRTHFALPTSLPKTYFLGHHKAGLDKMKHMLSTIDLVIECRDYRIPLTSRNPVLERELGLASGRANGGKERILVYTKCDLGIAVDSSSSKTKARQTNEILESLHGNRTRVHFSASPSVRPYLQTRQSSHRIATTSDTVKTLLQQIRAYARENFSLTGHRVLIAGMPNVGKSTLLNSLRKAGIPANHRGNKKVAQTGADPGVTRSVGSAVKILEAGDVEGLVGTNVGGHGYGEKSTGPAGVTEAVGEPVYLMDTPGIFPPYIHDPTSMLKLALCGCVKDTLLPPITVADFLLFHVNLRGGWEVYSRYCEPTNDILVLLDAVARKTGRLGKGAEADLEGSAIWVVKRWRQGLWGKFMLDDLGEKELELARAGGEEEGQGAVSWSQAQRKESDRRRTVARERRTA